MFDVPLDAWYSWVGLSLASLALFGVVASVPTTAPPDATAVANTVDRVAANDHATTAEHPLGATAIRLGPHRVGLRNDAGTAHASYAFGPVTPVSDDSALQQVLYGRPPSDLFESRRSFQQAVVADRTAEPAWQSVDRTLVVRRVSWEGLDVVLVDA
ncbi:hypothetical protein SAMN04487950_2012 [Halogranum rubrum]|uniref:Uncharacterized protein n=1 Tax=Halogranum rubrum TaxID=553466 RepID=A0A1I4EE25_9EURY|nr:hypothetical protein [Halogranum rubrum]SFL02421.1 hypothetical protein SAMN04487950_2012 [Halogranum rubrum]